MIETPGERLSRRLWTAILIIVAIAGLNWFSHNLAVVVVAAGVVTWIARAFLQAARRAQER